MINDFIKKTRDLLTRTATGGAREKKREKSVATDKNHVDANRVMHAAPLSELLQSAGLDGMNLRSFGITDIGLKRALNEDYFFRSDELGLYLVADGMGGHAAGEVASHRSTEVISEFASRQADDSALTWPYGFDSRLSPEGNALLTGIRLANQTLCTMQQERSELAGMGTTVAAIRLSGTSATLAHVGDSRIYRMRNGHFEQLTSDHSWVNEQLIKNIITPEEARNHRYKNVITRALGNRLDLDIDVRVEEVQPGDIFLLCTDGLSGLVEDYELEEMLTEQKSDLREAANRMVARANEAGGHDNVSVVLIAADAE